MSAQPGNRGARIRAKARWAPGEGFVVVIPVHRSCNRPAGAGSTTFDEDQVRATSRHDS